MSRFSETLVFLRKRDGLSQQQLADKLGMSRSIVGMYESNKRMPSFEMLEAIADIFNVNIDFLVGHIDDGDSSRIFRKNLAEIVNVRDRADLETIGIDLYEVDLIIKGAMPLSFDYACQLTEQLGESLDYMLGKTEDNICEHGIYSFTNHELAVIEAYRNNPHMQAAVNTLLGITDEEVYIPIAARSGKSGTVKIANSKAIKDALDEILPEVNTPKKPDEF